MGLLRRPLVPSDAGPWAALAMAIGEADGDDDVFGQQKLSETFGDPFRDYPRGSIGVFDAGAMAGFGVLTARPSAGVEHNMRFLAGVHPDHRGRGIGGDLISWAEATAPILHADRYPRRPLALGIGCLSTNTAAAALYAARGYAEARRYYSMVRDLSGELPAAAWPAGVTISGYTPDRLDEALAVRNDAFLDHWGTSQASAESWRHAYAESATFRPRYSFVADAGGEAVGVLLSHEYQSRPRAPELQINLVAVRASGRKRGIASALLAAVLRAARAGGYRTAVLHVDASSLTGAVRVYERVGFTIAKTWVSYRKPLPAA